MDYLFLKACRGEAVPRPPLWIMRQAGRYLPEYRELRRKVDFVTLCKTPDLAAEATLQPIERFGLDAAILFSDILVPAESMGFKVDFVPGPVIDRPVAGADDVDRIRIADTDEIAPYVYEAVRLLRRELEGKAPLIGFAAAPFTLAAYLVEGKGSRSFDRIKRMMFHAPGTAHALLDKIATVTERYLGAQVDAGAQAVQLFDSWAGLLSRADFREFALPYARRVLDSVDGSVTPRIYFALNNAHFLEEIRECGAEVVGMDWRLDLAEASSRLAGRFVLQGNLDPCVLLAGTDVVERKAGEVLAAGARAPGHVFNLGHGILPHTPVESVETLVATVQRGIDAGDAS